MPLTVSYDALFCSKQFEYIYAFIALSDRTPTPSLAVWCSDVLCSLHSQSCCCVVAKQKIKMAGARLFQVRKVMLSFHTQPVNICQL